MAPPSSDTWVLGPADVVTRALSVGTIVDVGDTDGGPLAVAIGRLAASVEGMFRSRVAPAWPDRATTDGSSAHLCARPAPAAVVLVGTTTYDFGPSAFPFRLDVAIDAPRVVLEVGDVDATGVPRQLRQPIMVAGAEPDLCDAQVVDGRRQRAVVWTPVVDLGPDDLG